MRFMPLTCGIQRTDEICIAGIHKNKRERIYVYPTIQCMYTYICLCVSLCVCVCVCVCVGVCMWVTFNARPQNVPCGYRVRYYPVLFDLRIDAISFLVSSRSVGVGTCSMMARVGAILSPLILILGDYYYPRSAYHFRLHHDHRWLPVLPPPRDAGQETPWDHQRGRDLRHVRCFLIVYKVSYFPTDVWDFFIRSFLCSSIPVLGWIGVREILQVNR